MHQFANPMITEIAKNTLQKNLEQKDFILIGLVGSTGAGKNTAAEILKANDAYVIDADKVTHNVLNKNADKIIATFQNLINPESLKTKDGQLNRKALGNLLFSNQQLLQKHENIVFPEITKAIKSEIANAKRKHKIIILNAPTLHKTTLINDCNFIIYISACTLIRILRIKKRDSISITSILSRIKNQKDFRKFYRNRDKIIFLKNNGTKNKLKQKLNAGINELKEIIL
ncbi:MAG: dephospho-CoA kinase [Treponema sp.]|nr:MAG: dephospho-CoA kinase [Treponema sp.]